MEVSITLLVVQASNYQAIILFIYTLYILILNWYSSEGIQLGNAGSGLGVIGTWTSDLHEQGNFLFYILLEIYRLIFLLPF